MAAPNGSGGVNGEGIGTSSVPESESVQAIPQQVLIFRFLPKQPNIGRSRKTNLGERMRAVERRDWWLWSCACLSPFCLL